MPSISVESLPSFCPKKKLQELVTQDTFLDYPKIFYGLVYEIRELILTLDTIEGLNVGKKINFVCWTDFLNKIFFYIEDIKQVKPIYVAEAFETSRSQETTSKLKACLFDLFKQMGEQSNNLTILQAYEDKIVKLIKLDYSLAPYKDKIEVLLTRLADENCSIWRFFWEDNEKEYRQAQEYRLGIFDRLIGLLSIENRIAKHVSQIKQYVLAFESEWSKRKFCEASEQLCEKLKNKNQDDLVEAFKTELERVVTYQDSWFLVSLLERVNTLLLTEDKTAFETSFREYQILIKKVYREALLSSFLGIISLLFVLPVLLDYQKTMKYFSQAKTNFAFFKLFTQLEPFNNRPDLVSDDASVQSLMVC